MKNKGVLITVFCVFICGFMLSAFAENGNLEPGQEANKDVKTEVKKEAKTETEKEAGKEAKTEVIKDTSEQTKTAAKKYAKIASEERGVWLNRSEMFVPKEQVSAFLDSCAKINLTTIYINTYYKGGAAYKDSKYVPQVDELKKIDYDVLAYIIEECHKRGMRAEAWVEYGFYSYHTKNAAEDKSRGAILDKNPELVAIAEDGKEFLHNQQWGDFYSLCPSNPASHEILINIFKEHLTRYNFDGLNLDRIRYPEKNFCFCPYCKKHFNDDTGIELKIYPDGTEENAKFISWREEQLNKFMEKLSNELRALKKGIIITSAVVPVEMKKAKGQDWFTWLKRGYLDAAIPMLYTDQSFDMNLKEIQQELGTAKNVFAGVNADTSSPEIIGKQIDKARESGMGGVVLWYSGKISDDIPVLEKSYFKEKSFSPFPLMKSEEKKSDENKAEKSNSDDKKTGATKAEKSKTGDEKTEKTK